MTKEQKDKILKTLAEVRNDYVRECNNRIEKEDGKIIGADYMLQRFLNVLRTEVEPKEKKYEHMTADELVELFTESED